MGQLDKLIRQTGAIAIRRGALTLIDKDTAISILDICESGRVRVLGVEGFSVDNDRVVPMMDAIGDFSSARSVAQSVSDARKFFAGARLAGLMFDLELQGEP